MEEKRIRVIIADDHDVVISGLKVLLEDEHTIEIVDWARDGKELIEKAAQLQPDVVLTDIRMPAVGGLDAIRTIIAGSQTRCIALSTFGSGSLIREALDAGAIGYILKNARRGEIINGIKTVARFESYYCSATEGIITKLFTKQMISGSKDFAFIFDQREIELIKYIAHEVSSEEISKKLFLSKRTVDGLRIKLISKMNVKSSTGILRYAIIHNLVTPEELISGYME